MLRRRLHRFLALVGAPLAAACSNPSFTVAPSEQPDGSIDAADAADSGDPSAVGTLGAPCSPSGAHACRGHGQRGKLRCEDGKWVDDGLCAANEVCDTRPGPTAGTCQRPDPACVGHAPGESFCDGAAGTTRRTCGPDLITSSTETCDSELLCSKSIGEKCAKCLDGEFRCEGALLKKCAKDQQGFVLADTCATEALCVDAYGKCFSPVCAAAEYRCTGDRLEKCREARTEWDLVKVCPKDLCDAAAGACRDCVTGAKECVGNAPRECDLTGHWKLQPTCTAPLPLCKAGVCSPGVCSAGEYRCSSDSLEKCNATFDGFDFVKTCLAGLCDAVGKECDDCKVGDSTCSGSTPMTCGSTGHWSSLAPCGGSSPVCKGGSCVAATCATGEYRCNVDTLEKCNSSLSGWDVVKACSPGLCDVVGKECDDCKGSDVSCLGSTPRSCDSGGHWVSGTPCASPTPTCSGGTCVAGGVFTGSFTSGVVSTPQCTDWNTFRAGLSASTTYAKVTIKGSLDTTGASCSGPTANTLCQALRTGTATGPTSCDGRSWAVGVGCGPVSAVELTATGGKCLCNTGFTVRPCINTLPNWGNATSTGTTCSPVSQTMTVMCE